MRGLRETVHGLQIRRHAHLFMRLHCATSRKVCRTENDVRILRARIRRSLQEPKPLLLPKVQGVMDNTTTPRQSRIDRRQKRTSTRTTTQRAAKMPAMRRNFYSEEKRHRILFIALQKQSDMGSSKETVCSRSMRRMRYGVYPEASRHKVLFDTMSKERWAPEGI